MAKLTNRKSKTTNPKSGFTLIEILVSLTLLTIVLGAVYGSFFSVQRALERFDNVSLKYHDTRTALDIMRREVESALIKNSNSKEKDVPKLSFIIKDRDVFGKSTSYLNLSAYSFRGTGLHTVSYFVEEKEGKLNLMKSEAPAALPAEEYELEIIEGIESFTVETLYNRKWVRTWDTENTGRLPESIRIHIEFDDNGKMVEMTEYAKPKIDTRL
jgi:type II secretion system protein J